VRCGDLNSHGTATGRGGSVLPKHFIMAFSMLRLKLTVSYVFLMPKNSIHGLKMSFPVNFRFISGEISAEKFFLETFYGIERFVFEFQRESLQLFLSYRDPFRRYQHFRRIWQSTASLSRDC